MRNTFRIALFTAGLMAAALPMSALAAKAPTPPRETRLEHKAAELANAKAIAALRGARVSSNVANHLAIAAARQAIAVKRAEINKTNDAARVKGAGEDEVRPRPQEGEQAHGHHRVPAERHDDGAERAPLVGAVYPGGL